MTDQEDAFRREVQALERYDGRRWRPRYEVRPYPTYTEYAAYYREVARRAMTISYLAEEADKSVKEGPQQPATAPPELEPE